VDEGLATYKNFFKANKDEFIRIENKSAEELYQYLPVLFAKDLTECTKERQEPLVVFLDTYEQLVNEMSSIGEPLNNDLWLRDEINGLIVNSPKVFWVIAGREKLKWQQFTAWDESLEQHILGNLSETDAENFLSNAGIDAENLRHGIYELTQGTPVYLDLCVDRYCSLSENGLKPAIEDFGKNIYALIERFARYMDDTKKDIVYMLSCMKIWTDEMADKIGAKVLPNFTKTTYEKVKGFSFIIESEKNHYNLHQTVGETLLQNCPDSIKQSTIAEAIGYCKGKLDEIDTFSNDYEYYAGWLIKYAMGYFVDDEELRFFYKDNIRVYLKKLSDARRFDAIDELYEPFWERASRNQESRLFALAMKDYSIWLQSKGRYQEAIDIAKKSYELYVKILGENDAAALSAQREYAMGLHLRGRYKEALEIRKDVLKKRIELLGEESLETIESYVDLGNSLSKFGLYQDQPEGALKIYQLRKKILTANDPFIFRSRRNFVNVYINLGENKKAYDESVVLVSDVERVLGKDCDTSLDMLGTYAKILKKIGQYDKALEIRKDVYERRKKLQGENHPKTLDAMRSLSGAYIDLGQYGEALPLKQEILEKRKALYGNDHPKTLKAIWGVAYVLEQMGRYQEALALRQEIYESYRRTQGEDFPDTITAYGNIAGIYNSLGQYDKVLEIRKDVYERWKKLQGDEHPKTLDAMRSLSSAYIDMGQYAEALPIKQIILEKRKALYGNDHPKTLNAIWGVAYVLEQMGHYQDALSLRQEIYESYKRTQGEDYPDTIDAYGNIAIDYKSLGQYDKALKIRKEVYEHQKKLHGDNHPETLGAKSSLSKAYIDSCLFDEAISLRKELLVARRQINGDDSLETIAALNLLAWAYFLKGAPEEGIPYAEEMKNKMKNNPNVGEWTRISDLDTLALLYASANRLEKAYELATTLLQKARAQYATDEKFIAARQYALAFILNKMERFVEALDYAQKAFDVRMKYLGEFNEATKRSKKLLDEIKKIHSN
jgi:hypothetical protein